MFSPPIGSDVDTILAGGSSGVDTLDFSALQAALSINISNSSQQGVSPGLWLTISAGGNVIDNVVGTALGDSITGNSLNNLIDGGGGDDSNLSGGGGDDTIRGGTGNDSLYGGEGDDILDRRGR